MDYSYRDFYLLHYVKTLIQIKVRGTLWGSVPNINQIEVTWRRYGTLEIIWLVGFVLRLVLQREHGSCCWEFLKQLDQTEGSSESICPESDPPPTPPKSTSNFQLKIRRDPFAFLFKTRDYKDKSIIFELAVPIWEAVPCQRPAII